MSDILRIARGTDLYLVQIFRASPLMALALCMCLATIFWCILLARRQQGRWDRRLTGLLGMIAIYEAFRVLKEWGVIRLPGYHFLDGWVDFVIAATYVVAGMLLKRSGSDRANTKVRLRLVEANEKIMEVGRTGSPPETTHAVFDASPLATFAVDNKGVVIYWNGASERLLGWKREQILGQRLPFGAKGPLQNNRGNGITAAIWTAPINSPNGAPRGTLIIAAGAVALREAGLGTSLPSSTEMALNH
jgi:PAS domain-containing protein